jgi:hypothetical protein
MNQAKTKQENLIFQEEKSSFIEPIGQEEQKISDESNQNEINSINCFSKVIRSGKRTYFFDVKENKSGKRYLTITESRQLSDAEGNAQGYRKNKVFLHREDIDRFVRALYDSANHLPWGQPYPI